MRRASLLTAAVFAGVVSFASPVAAAERELCPDRPGLGTPACTVDRGRVQVETALIDWTLDKGAGSRTDTILVGDTLVRVGISDAIELQLGWTPYGYTRERTGGATDRASRVGDVMVGAKVNLHNPDGSGFSAALLPFATLPTGRQPIGAGDWGAGLVMPLSYELSNALSLQLTPEVDAAVDEDGAGRHLAYGGVLGLGIDLSKQVSTTLEVQVTRDRDPAGHSTEAYGALSFAYQPSDNLQLDIGSSRGLNHASSDVELYAGISKRF